MILHLIDSQGMYGAERVVIMLLSHLKDSKFRGILGCIREREDEVPVIAREAQRMGISLHYFTMKRGFNPFGLHQINKYVIDERIRVIHSHGYKGDIYAGLLRRRDIKKISTVHGWSQNTEGLRMSLYEYVHSKMLSRMSRVVAVSQAVKGDLMSRGVIGDKIDLIYNGIGMEQFKPTADLTQLRQRFGIQKEVSLIGAVGRLENIKGHLFLLDAMKILREDKNSYHLAIAGDGPLKDDIIHHIRQHRLESCVTLLGFTDQIHEFLSMIDIFIMPSLSEGMPLALLEAMAHRKPVVASSVGGITEVIEHDKNGILVPPGNAGEIVRVIRELTRNPARMAEIAAEGCKTVAQRFTSQVMVKDYINLYSEALAA